MTWVNPWPECEFVAQNGLIANVRYIPAAGGTSVSLRCHSAGHGRFLGIDGANHYFGLVVGSVLTMVLVPTFYTLVYRIVSPAKST